MTVKKPFTKRLVAGAGAFALATAGIVALGSPAYAAVGPDQPEHPTEGSLIIHKVEGEQATTPSDGTVQDMTGRTLLNGVEFTVRQLGIDNDGTCEAIDLGDTDAWTEQIPTSTAPADADGVLDEGFCLIGTGTALSTSVDGSVTFPDLDLGLYYVQETNTVGATNATTGEAVTIVSHAAPFYVTIPLPNDGDWIYDVHAYPKNQIVDAPVKTINEDVEQTGLHIGDTVEFTIKQTVPEIDATDSYTSASIWDNFGTDFAYDDTVTFTLTPAGGTAIELEENTHYEIVKSYELTTWELTSEGLALLEAGAELEVVFTATVLNVTTTGEIGNPGSTDPSKPGYGSKFNDTPSPEGPTPYTYWGNLKVVKVDQDDVPLVGAEFQVYPQVGGTCTAEVPTSGLVSTGTSDATGLVQWDFATPASSPLGLFVANSIDGPLTSAEKVYCLYETHVPAGYTGVEVQPVTISAGAELVVDVNHLTIKNFQKEGPDLPLTGAQGTMLMTAAGLAVVALGAALVVVSRRRKNNQVA